MTEEKIKAYNDTYNAISDCLTECDNFNDFDWCSQFGCELIHLCKDIKETFSL